MTKKRQLHFFGLCLGILFAIPLQVSGQDDAKAFLGKWDAVAETDDGDQTHVMEIKNGPDGLSGTITNETERELSSVEVNDGKLSFEFEMEAQGNDLLIVIVYSKKKNSLEGEWSAFMDGNEVASGPASAKRVESGPNLAGQWTSVAVLPDGNEMQSALELSGGSEGMQGTLVNDRGVETEISNVTTTDKSFRMEFEIEVQGELRDVVVEAELADDNTLEGEWALFVDGEEAASGEWSATRDAAAEAVDAATTKSTVVFDGSSLDNFRGYKQEKIGDGWKIVDGALHLDGTKSGDIITKQEYGDFELEFEWKISEAGNSGVIYRSSLGDNQSYLTGPEFQVLDDEKHSDSSPKTSSGSLYGLYAPKGKTLKPVGEWNTAKLVLKGNSVEHWLNGTKVVSAEIGSDDWNARVANSKFKTWEKFAKNKKGHICFQDHGNPVWYRNIKIKPLD